MLQICKIPIKQGKIVPLKTERMIAKITKTGRSTEQLILYKKGNLVNRCRFFRF